MIDVPQAAVELAKRFEGFHRVPKNDPSQAHPYICPARYWTIGYGRLCKPDHPPESAKQFLPKWLGDADESDESITIPDEQMLAVLQPYDQDFIYKLAIRHWCPECKELQSNVICGDKDRELAGKRSKWTSEWYCMHGHLVHAEQNEIKFF
jgi:hypothetical protein